MASVLKLAIFTLLAVSLPSVAVAQGRIARDDYYRLGKPCACPEDKAKDNSKCGRRSAFCRCNGYEPLGCFQGDNDPKQRASIQLQYCGFACPVPPVKATPTSVEPVQTKSNTDHPDRMTTGSTVQTAKRNAPSSKQRSLPLKPLVYK